MNPKKKVKPLQGKTFWQTLLNKVKKILTILFAMGIDKHLDYNQDDVNRKTDKKEKKVD
ncbi:MAG: hypothetical protein JSV46_05930 [Candidatus Aminicenantes bacterium]|nr:MAG: hypothetical protein JSV46_05930 [Candidatus Aminicenantes bacterium]